MMMRIGIDLDGVCYPYGLAFRHYLIQHCGWEPSLYSFEDNKWKFYQDLGMTDAEYWTHHINGINAGVIFNWGDPFERVTRAVNMMKDRGHQVFIVTDRNAGRPGYAMQLTAEWLERYGIPYDGIYFGGIKDAVSGVDAMIDDRVKNVYMMQEAGVETWLMDRSYNRDVIWQNRAVDLVDFLEQAEEKFALKKVAA